MCFGQKIEFERKRLIHIQERALQGLERTDFCDIQLFKFQFLYRNRTLELPNSENCKKICESLKKMDLPFPVLQRSLLQTNETQFSKLNVRHQAKRN